MTTMEEIPVTESSSFDAQLYLQIESDWNTANESCCLDVYERTVEISSSKDAELAQNDSLITKVYSSPSFQYQLPLSTSLSTSTTPHMVEILNKDDAWIHVQVNFKRSESSTQQLRTIFQAPKETIDVPLVDGSKAPETPEQALLQLEAVDVSKNERYVAFGGSNGVGMVWDIENRTRMVPLEGHVADITSIRFFPSSQVVLTGSLDFTLRIWSVNGQCAAVLTGHHGGIEDVGIVGRGRNVLSCGMDGLIHLWHSGTQEVVAKWANDDQSPVHCLTVFEDKTQVLVDDKYPISTNEYEAETEGKVVCAGLGNGETLGVDLRSRNAVFNVEKLAGAIVSVAALPAFSMLYTGSEDGLLAAWDLRSTRVPVSAVSRSSSSIRRILVSKKDSKTVWTAHGDGVCCQWNEWGEKLHVATTLTGPDYDPVRDVAIAEQTGRIFTVCRDGRVREYLPKEGVVLNE